MWLSKSIVILYFWRPLERCAIALGVDFTLGFIGRPVWIKMRVYHERTELLREAILLSQLEYLYLGQEDGYPEYSKGFRTLTLKILPFKKGTATFAREMMKNRRNSEKLLQCDDGGLRTKDTGGFTLEAEVPLADGESSSI